MKQWMILTLTTLSLGNLAFANYVCQNDGQEKLTVTHLPSASTNSKTESILATLETPLQTQNFNGFHNKVGGYHLSDDQGQSVELQLSKSWVEYGGHCGRCTPKLIENTFAKLTLPNGEIHNFTCQ